MHPASTPHEPPLVVLDDGRFYVEFVETGADRGYLRRRCYVGVTTPDGCECVGSLERSPSGIWRSQIDVKYGREGDRDHRDLGSFGSRLESIMALWNARHDAYCRHQDY